MRVSTTQYNSFVIQPILYPPLLSTQSLFQADATPTTADGETAENIDLPELEIIELQLAKDKHGLGITIAGYVCEQGE